MSTHNIGFYEDLTKIIFELYSYNDISHCCFFLGSGMIASPILLLFIPCSI